MDNDKYIGRLLDNRYEILEVIGVGGMAVVYKARCHRLNRLVAVKILKDDYSQDDEFRRRFHAEGQAVAMVSHPNIVSVYDVSTSNDADYIVMELIDGISLKQYMEKKGVLNWKETLHFAIQIGKALEHAHGRGIVHRDIKPHNVMVLKNGSVKVADFGIARVMSESNTLTREALGSVHYISPEQAKGGRVDNRSDIYSLGVVMYEMMTGRPPYDGESPVAVAIQHINGGAAMPSTLNPNIPGGLEQIIMKAMAHDPAARYNSAAAMLYDMDEFRKNPVILFDYNVPPTDAVVRLSSAAAAGAGAAAVAGAASNGTGPVPRTTPPRTTAERVAADKNAPARRRPAEGGAAAAAAGAAAGTGAVRRRTGNTGPVSQPGNQGGAPRRRREEPEDDNRAATIAVIVCSAVFLLALIILLMVSCTGGFSGSGRDMISTPDLLGKEYVAIQEKYAYNDNIHIKTNSDREYSYSDKYEKGQIMAQKPAPGDEVPKGTTIYVTISMGKEPEIEYMENHIGKTEDETRGYLDAQKVNLTVEVVLEPSKDVEEGRVIRTAPVEGERLTDNMVVTLYISSGPEVVELEMEDLTKKTVEEATKWLDNQKLDLEVKVEEEENLEKEEGTILRTKPAAGEKVKTGDTVILYVAKGMKTELMPSLTGMTFDQAKKALADLEKNLNLKVEKMDGYDKSAELGKVIRTEPAYNEKIKTGDTVLIYVCVAQKAKIANVVGMNVEAAKMKLSEVQGFTKVTVEYKTSDKAKDTVIKQSVAPDTETELDSPIVLTVSSGQKSVKKSVQLVKNSTVGGEGEPTNVKVVVTNTTTGQVVYSGTVSTASSTVELSLTGYGVMNYEIVVEDGIERGSFSHDFDS